MRLSPFIWLVLCSVMSAHAALAVEPIKIGSRRELFVDKRCVGRTSGELTQQLHRPVAREVALTFDQPWEGNASGYPTVIQDGDLYRMYYRGHRYLIDDPPLRQAQPEVVCYAESRDGVNWLKPNLGLFEWNGSKNNNIIWRDSAETHNFAPFKDTNPNCEPNERYKAIGGTKASNGLSTFKSADGIHWSRLSQGPVVTEGAFDSHNTAFWDADQQRYSMYVRYFSKGNFQGLRLIGVTHSRDFETWTPPVGLTYPDSPPQQMYTNQVAPYYRAPHLLFGFPTRYVARPLTNHVQTLDPVPLRKTLTAATRRVGTDLTEGLFMSSRDGLSFHRWNEAFLRPGPQLQGRWLYGDNYQSYGLWEAKTDQREISMHFSEGAWQNDVNRVRRYTMRLDGFVSMHASYSGGSVTTKPLLFSGQRLSVNYATSAAGGLRVELRDKSGQPISGFSLQDSEELYGDSTDQVVAWRGGPSLGTLSDSPIQIHFELRDADLYSFQFID